MKKVCVVTATRAEYWLLKPLLQQIKEDVALTLQLIVTGTHLLEAFGSTYKEIEKEFTIDRKIAMDLSRDDKASLSSVMGQLQIDITKAFVELSPDIVVILGDRYEMLSVASAAMMLQIPIAHIHGGEIILGAIDNTIRDAISKLSDLHFTSTQVYAKRVQKMGEEKVFNVGALGVEKIKNIKLLSKEAFEASLGVQLKEKNLLVTYYPQTLSSFSAKEQMQELLAALETLENTLIIFTKANADEGGKKVINAMIDVYVEQNPDNAVSFESLGMLRYFSAVKYVDAVVGNSSSGILEVPSFHKSTVNIGERQQGRIQAKSIINALIKRDDISKAIQRVYEREFQALLQKVQSPYEFDRTSHRIKEIIKEEIR